MIKYHQLLMVSRLRMVVVVIGVLLAWWLLFPATHPSSASTHIINLDMQQFEFTPGRLEVSLGDEIVVNLSSSDVVHGFYLDEYGIEQRVEPGITRQITFIADKSGKYRYRCLVNCGPLHPFMIGELVVHPNNPFIQAAGLLILTFVGILISHWQNGVQHEQDKTKLVS